jgi:hypothetical protein
MLESLAPEIGGDERVGAHESSPDVHPVLLRPDPVVVGIKGVQPVALIWDIV